MEKMKLLIDAKGGIAGDMFSAALISAGANQLLIKNAMLSAANKIGSADITFNSTIDKSLQLKIKLKSKYHHLSGTKAKFFLIELFKEFKVTKEYRNFGFKILETLLHAEKKAHALFNIVMPGDSAHSHHHHHSEDETLLHEAQDIVIDIVGATIGMQSLNIELEAKLISPVSVGRGFINFSHGEFPVPAPATKIILEEKSICWQKGPIDKELCTPTGASILAALKSKFNPVFNNKDVEILKTGQSRGSNILPIEPLKIYILKNKK